MREHDYICHPLLHLCLYLVQLRMYTVYVSLEKWIRNTHMPLGGLQFCCLHCPFQQSQRTSCLQMLICFPNAITSISHICWLCWLVCLNSCLKALQECIYMLFAKCQLQKDQKCQALSNRTPPKKIQHSNSHQFASCGFEPPGQASNKPCAAAASNGARDDSTCAASHIGGTELVVCEDIF